MPVDPEAYKAFDAMMRARGSFPVDPREVRRYARKKSGIGFPFFKIGDIVHFKVDDNGNLNTNKAYINNDTSTTPYWTCTVVLNGQTSIQFWPGFLRRTIQEYILDANYNIVSTGNIFSSEPPLPLIGDGPNMYDRYKGKTLICKDVQSVSTLDYDNSECLCNRKVYTWEVVSDSEVNNR